MPVLNFSRLVSPPPIALAMGYPQPILLLRRLDSKQMDWVLRVLKGDGQRYGIALLLMRE